MEHDDEKTGPLSKCSQVYLCAGSQRQSEEGTLMRMIEREKISTRPLHQPEQARLVCR